jgi:hypothetical protein
VGAFALEPGARDAALLITLDPGTYTATIRGVGGATGDVLAGQPQRHAADQPLDPRAHQRPG